MKDKKMTFLPQKVPVGFFGNPSILEVAIDNNISLGHSCGGMGSCTTCLVEVIAGGENLNPRNELEREHALARDYKPSERLACQTLALDGLVVKIPVES